ncbi:MaoC dehydratase-like protein [Salsuginibacillus halophilus]|uniref:MaoC dehydratase-like protein n=1 Tax=Salsuginibacillus halophilus TaxID=517424 RepID=A0A2P8HKW6_9BACI|nr:MaoC family dehydratase N-terminal domain-containing protein [Salsuginibacillus halophilus]PSL46863.1 MaoC dehydratase-like protein [Salsuginibacillus halophilus]
MTKLKEGMTSPTFTFDVNQKVITEMAAVTARHIGVHTDVVKARAAGYHNILAPPGFHSKIWQQADLPWFNGMSGTILHLKEEVTVNTPITAGLKLSCSVELNKVRERRGQTWITQRTTAHCQKTQALLLTIYSTFLHYHDAPYNR